MTCLGLQIFRPRFVQRPGAAVSGMDPEAPAVLAALHRRIVDAEKQRVHRVHTWQLRCSPQSEALQRLSPGVGPASVCKHSPLHGHGALNPNGYGGGGAWRFLGPLAFRLLEPFLCPRLRSPVLTRETGNRARISVSNAKVGRKSLFQLSA